MTRKKPISSRKIKLPKGIETLKSKPRANVSKDTFTRELEIQRDTKLDDAGEINNMIEIARFKMSNEEGKRMVVILKSNKKNLQEEAQDLDDNISQIKGREERILITELSDK